jgi:glycerophosphoryl diester phosphodiesterase
MKQLFELVWGNFWRSKWTYARLYFTITILISILVIPMLKSGLYVGQWVDEVPYFSLSNFGQVILANPIFDVALVIVIILLLIALSIQLATNLAGFAAVHAGQKPTVTSAAKYGVARLAHVGFTGTAFMAFYAFLALPFPMLAMHSDLLDDVKIPAFVWPTILATPWMIISITILVILALYLVIKFFYVLPEMILGNARLGEAIKLSWQKTHGRMGLRLAIKLYIGSLMVGASTLVGFGLVWLLQFGLDKVIPTDFAILGGVATFTLATLINIFFGIIGLQFVFGLMAAGYPVPALVDYRAKGKVTHGVIATLLLLSAFIEGFAPSVLFVTNTSNRHLTTYSHRGVDDADGVQNTIPALEATVAKAHPDYVEMDIRQTKDGKWVVMHDPNLATLTRGASKVGVEKLTLAEVTALTVYENGHEAKIPSFDEYAAAAQRLNVKLLVEIKTERTSAADLANSFLNQYKPLMTATGWHMHSLNYDVVQRLKKLDSSLRVGMIMPGDFLGSPVTSADFYTMEYSYLTQAQVEDLNERGKSVLAWTVNDDDAMVSVYAQGVQGEITDQITDLQSVLADTKAAKLMHQKLGVYIVNILSE